MNILGFNITRSPSTTVKKSATETPISEAAIAWMRGDDSPPFGQPTLTNAYQQSVWVYRAINVLAEQLANVPFVFANQGRGRKTLLTSGPLVDFTAIPQEVEKNGWKFW